MIQRADKSVDGVQQKGRVIGFVDVAEEIIHRIHSLHRSGVVHGSLRLSHLLLVLISGEERLIISDLSFAFATKINKMQMPKYVAKLIIESRQMHPSSAYLPPEFFLLLHYELRKMSGKDVKACKHPFVKLFASAGA